ncbi:hypothetical protein PVAP13_5KG456300 [Panicum virgatum]|uniref:Uncharacterized protein n=1 Tax=Panicum virgatum TaxID=38727 RepID=A0A8T0SQD0_PANVG|nr:hypothetical protein PVAP13_5KG456300 [Panicum virgatum]
MSRLARPDSEKRADALRDAAARYQGLQQLEKQISSFVDDRALHRDAALGKMFSLFEKCEFSSWLAGAECLNPMRALTGRVPLFLCRTKKSVYRFMQERDAADANCQDQSRVAVQGARHPGRLDVGHGCNRQDQAGMRQPCEAVHEKKNFGAAGLQSVACAALSRCQPSVCLADRTAARSASLSSAPPRNHDSAELTHYMRVVSEIDGLGSKNDEQNRETALFKRLKEQNREVLLHQGVRFAFRVHQIFRSQWGHGPLSNALSSASISLQEDSLLIAWMLLVS